MRHREPDGLTTGRLKSNPDLDLCFPQVNPENRRSTHAAGGIQYWNNPRWVRQWGRLFYPHQFVQIGGAWRGD